jgi:hypothetical protein
MRTELWLSQLHREQGAGAAAAARFASLARQPLPDEVVAEIEKDTHRTFPGHAALSGRAGQRSMLRVLRAYAALDPEVGYTQVRCGAVRCGAGARAGLPARCPPHPARSLIHPPTHPPPPRRA